MARAGLVCGARYHQLCSATDIYITPGVQGARGVQEATCVQGAPSIQGATCVQGASGVQGATGAHVHTF